MKKTSEAQLVSGASLRALLSSVRLHPAGAVLHCRPVLEPETSATFALHKYLGVVVSIWSGAEWETADRTGEG